MFFKGQCLCFAVFPNALFLDRYCLLCKQHHQALLFTATNYTILYMQNAQLRLSHGLFPVQSRIIVKLCTIAYQILSSGEPSHLFSMLSLASKPRELHSSGFHLLSVPRVKTYAGIRAFSVAVSTLWNSLSEHVMSSNNTVSFRHHLKTFQTRLSFLRFHSI